MAISDYKIDASNTGSDYQGLDLEGFLSPSGGNYVGNWQPHAQQIDKLVKALVKAKLNGLIDALVANVVNNLTSTDGTKYLSAAMGKSLQDNKVDKDSTVNVHMDARNDATISLSAGASLALSFPTIDSSSGITYNGTTKEFTVVNAGWYLVTAVVQFASASDTFLFLIDSGGRQYINKNPNIQYNTISAIINLGAGQKVTVFGNSAAANSIAASNANVRIAKIR